MNTEKPLAEVVAEVRRLSRKSLKTFIAEVLRKCGGSMVKSLKTLCGGLRRLLRKLHPLKGYSAARKCAAALRVAHVPHAVEG